MKKLFTGVLSLAVLAGVFVAFAEAPTVNAAAPACKATAVGTKNSANKEGSKFTIKNNKVTASYKLTGSKDCKLTMELISWTAPNPTDGKPYSEQREVDRVSKTAGPGTYTLTANMKDCYYQVDLVFKGSQEYSVRNIGYAHGGTRSCNGFEPVPNQPNQPNTPQTPSTPNTPQTPQTPSTPATPVAAVTPATPVETTPTEIAKTGPQAMIAQLFGATSLVGSLGYYIQSRRNRL